MKNKLLKLFLSIVSMLPYFANASIIADVKLDEMDNKMLNEKLLDYYANLRSNIMPMHKSQSTLPEALEYYKLKTGLSGNELNQAFDSELQRLLDKKAINIDQYNNSISGGASGIKTH